MNLKTIFFSVILLCTYFSVSAQLKRTLVCPGISIDILDGIVNQRLTPNSTPDYIKDVLPCYASAPTDGSQSKCGAGVFYKDKDLYFYTDRHYIEIGPLFKGKMSLPLMGAARNGLFKILGNPQIKDIHWDAYQTSYGILILYFNGSNHVDKIQFSTMQASTIQLCE